MVVYILLPMGNWTDILLFLMLYLRRAHALAFIYVPYFVALRRFLLAPIFGVLQKITIENDMLKLVESTYGF